MAETREKCSKKNDMFSSEMAKKSTMQPTEQNDWLFLAANLEALGICLTKVPNTLHRWRPIYGAQSNSKLARKSILN